MRLFVKAVFALDINSSSEYRGANTRVGGQLHAHIPVAESVIGGAEAQFQVRSAPKSWGEWGDVLSFCVESDEQAATGEDFGLLWRQSPLRTENIVHRRTSSSVPTCSL